MAKGLGSGYAPLGATLFPSRWADPLAESVGFGFSHTYCANPISCATGVAVLEEYERQDVIANTVEQGAYLRKGLEALKQTSPVIGDIRGMGLCMAVELVADKATKTPFPLSFAPTDYIRIAGLSHGLIIYARRTAKGRNGDWIVVAPPMNVTREECDQCLTALRATLADFERDVRARGLIA
jgi:adenosylmethionine-8-amino-7-oxononanoate aminotransferase